MNNKITPARLCPHCATPMSPCDYSPIYGHSWYHPESTKGTYHCKHSGAVLFGGFDLSWLNEEQEELEEK